MTLPHFVILDQELTLNSVQYVETIDISSFESDAYISITLPDYPGGSINEALTYLDLTSEPGGDFSTGPTVSIPWSSSSPALPNTTGDVEARLPFSLVTGIDKTAVTGVRFRIEATGVCDVKVMALRVCAADWELPPLDFDTLYQRVLQPPTRTGDPTDPVEFPTNAVAGMPTDFPIVFRAGDLSSSHDPKPINAELSVFFSAGSLVEGDNQISFYLREQPLDNQIQLELNELTQGDLNVQGHQPDFGTASFTTRTQDSLDTQDQDDIDGESQLDLGRLPDYVVRDWIEVKLLWNATDTEISIKNADGVGYEFAQGPLNALDSGNADEGRYLLLIKLSDNSCRAQIYMSDQVGSFIGENAVFDTYEVRDDTFIKKIKGRVGWYAQFADGDAYMQNIRSRRLSFGEMVTKGFNSITPVIGASLFTGSTSDNEYFTELWGSPWGQGTVTDDAAASTSGLAKRIDAVVDGGSLQGFQTNTFLLDTFTDFKISLDVKFPSAALRVPGGGLLFFLYGENGRCIPLNTRVLTGDKWEHIDVRLDDELLQTGIYRLIGVTSVVEFDTTWWIDRIRISAPVIRWTARGRRDDAWHLSGEDDWMPFLDTLNTTHGGVVFRERGTSMQVRAEALRQSAEIRDFKAIPQYAGLGRFIWDEPAPGSPPTAQIQTSEDGLTVSVNGSLSADAEGMIAAYYWSWGDDTFSYGGQVSHTYATAGDYTIVLTVVDDTGNVGSTMAEVSVS